MKFSTATCKQSEEIIILIKPETTCTHKEMNKHKKINN